MGLSRNQRIKRKNSPPVETFKEEQVFLLTKEEAEKCRFRIIDQNLRLAECFVHDGHHGIRLFPIHKWKLDKDGKVYYKEGKRWVRYIPDPINNKVRLR